MSEVDDETFLRWERENRARNERFKSFLVAEGRPDLASEYEQRVREIDNGVATARAVWHSISPAQRKVLARAGEHGSRFYSTTKSPRRVTVDHLVRRDLLAWHADAALGLNYAAITEHGLFTLTKGRP